MQEDMSQSPVTSEVAHPAHQLGKDQLGTIEIQWCHCQWYSLDPLTWLTWPGLFRPAVRCCWPANHPQVNNLFSPGQHHHSTNSQLQFDNQSLCQSRSNTPRPVLHATWMLAAAWLSVNHAHFCLSSLSLSSLSLSLSLSSTRYGQLPLFGAWRMPGQSSPSSADCWKAMTRIQQEDTDTAWPRRRIRLRTYGNDNSVAQGCQLLLLLRLMPSHTTKYHHRKNLWQHKWVGLVVARAVKNMRSHAKLPCHTQLHCCWHPSHCCPQLTPTIGNPLLAVGLHMCWEHCPLHHAHSLYGMDCAVVQNPVLVP